MKKLLTLLTFILITTILFGQEYKQDTIISNKNEVIPCKISSIDKKTIRYIYMDGYSKRPGKINLTEITYWSWNSNKEKERQIREEISKREQVIKNKMLNISSGDYLKKSGTFMIIGTSIPIVGNIIAGVFSKENPDARWIGIGSGIVGLTFDVIGMVYLIKSGERHNNEKDISLYLTPTQNGIGLCMKF